MIALSSCSRGPANQRDNSRRRFMARTVHGSAPVAIIADGSGASKATSVIATDAQRRSDPGTEGRPQFTLDLLRECRIAMTASETWKSSGRSLAIARTTRQIVRNPPI